MFKLLTILPCLMMMFQPLNAKVEAPNYNFSLDTLADFFPEKKIARLDLDATRAKHAFQQIIHSFENNETQILVGTQMVTKGLDFRKDCAV